MQEEEALADAPERSRAELVRPGRSLIDAIRQDPIPCGAGRSRNKDDR